MTVSSILVKADETPAAGILTPGSPLAVWPSRLLPVAVRDDELPGHSGGTVLDSHQVP